MLDRTLHLPAAGEDLAQWCQVSYIDGDLTRREILRTSGASDGMQEVRIVSTSVQNVIFDLGGVLLHWDPDGIVAAVFEDPQTRATVRRVVFDHPDWLALDQGTLAEEEAVQGFAERAGQPLGAMVQLMDQVRASLTPKPDTLVLLEELDERGVPLYCLSNMHARNIAYLREHYDFFGRFRGTVISAHVKLVKPAPGIFQHLLASCALDPARSVFVDDHPANVEGARAAGLQAVLFTDAADCRQQLGALLGFAGSG